MLLFSSETRNLTPSALKKLEGFHTRCEWRMEEYISLRRKTVAMWIVDRPGTSALRQWWWEQPMGLETGEELLAAQFA